MDEPDQVSTSQAPEGRVAEVSRGPVRARFDVSNPTIEWRVRTLFTKEPDTIQWIDTFLDGDVMLDVGANVGMYTIWAAMTRGARVVALEPESQNYAVLNRNVHLNGLGERVAAYCVAASDADGFNFLYLGSFCAGDACHNFGESVGYDGRPMPSAFRQGCVAVKIDSLVRDGVVPVPNHVKIDVDGIEPRVIQGAAQTLRDLRVRSVLIEINTNLDEHWEIVDTMIAAGFDYSQEQIERAQRREGPFKGVGNYIFRR